LQHKHQIANSDFFRQQLNLRSESLFPTLDPAICAQEIRDISVGFGFQLPSQIVYEIHEFACQKPLYEPGYDDEFYVDDIQGGFLLGGRPVLRGLVKNLSDCAAIEQVAQDPVLMEIARNYLQYWPIKVTRHLTWTFVSNLSISEQKDRFLPLSYHYDVAGYNFMTAYFYITDMDIDTGAHVMMARSHDKKPLHTLFTPWSGRQSDQVIWDYYGKDNEILIEGKAGLGFVQDPSCYHKLLSPIKAKRLIFQIRYA
jgi:hypothetical protein